MRGCGGQGGSSFGPRFWAVVLSGEGGAVDSKPATAAMKPAPVSVRAFPADSLLGITRHGPAFEFACLITGSGVSGSEVAGFAGCVCADDLAAAETRSDASTAAQQKRRRRAGLQRSATWQRRRFASSPIELVLKEQVIKELDPCLMELFWC